MKIPIVRGFFMIFDVWNNRKELKKAAVSALELGAEGYEAKKKRDAESKKL